MRAKQEQSWNAPHHRVGMDPNDKLTLEEDHHTLKQTQRGEQVTIIVQRSL